MERKDIQYENWFFNKIPNNKRKERRSFLKTTLLASGGILFGVNYASAISNEATLFDVDEKLNFHDFNIIIEDFERCQALRKLIRLSFSLKNLISIKSIKKFYKKMN